MMRSDSCRKCGKDMIPHEKCTTCDVVISLICNNCGITTDNQIHTHPLVR